MSLGISEILRFHTNPDPIDVAIALALSAHRAFIERMAKLIACEEHGKLNEVEALKLEVAQLRQLVAQMAA